MQLLHTQTYPNSPTAQAMPFAETNLNRAGTQLDPSTLPLDFFWFSQRLSRFRRPPLEELKSLLNQALSAQLALEALKLLYPFAGEDVETHLRSVRRADPQDSLPVGDTTPSV